MLVKAVQIPEIPCAIFRVWASLSPNTPTINPEPMGDAGIRGGPPSPNPKPKSLGRLRQAGWDSALGFRASDLGVDRPLDLQEEKGALLKS